MTPLPDDVCRCLDSSCYERESCRRWLERGQQGPRVAFAASLFPDDVPLGDPCPLRIPYDAPLGNPCPLRIAAPWAPPA